MVVVALVIEYLSFLKTIVVSSTNRTVLYKICANSSITKIISRSRLNTEPCGTPLEKVTMLQN